MSAAPEIWKFPLDIRMQTIPMPCSRVANRAPRLLDVQDQDGQLFLWAMVHPTESLVDRTVAVVGTGQPLSSFVTGALHYGGTVQQGPLVWHVFADFERHQ